MDKHEKVKTDDNITKLNDFLHPSSMRKCAIVNCKHTIVRDYIDITPDRGCNIKYCSKCGKTF